MNVGSEAEVVHRWFERCHTSGVPLAAANAMGERLVEAYGHPDRHYHDLGHIRHVLDLAGQFRLDESVRTEVEFALWFHDLVYDPQRSDNEQQSAIAAREWLAGQGLAFGGSVGALVEMTAGHGQVDRSDRAAAVVHDVDLAILGSGPDEYRRYVEAIRCEYGHLDDVTFAAGRTAILSHLAAADALFVTTELGPVLEARARANIAHELVQLRITAS